MLVVESRDVIRFSCEQIEKSAEWINGSIRRDGFQLHFIFKIIRQRGWVYKMLDCIQRKNVYLVSIGKE